MTVYAKPNHTRLEVGRLQFQIYSILMIVYLSYLDTDLTIL